MKKLILGTLTCLTITQQLTPRGGDFGGGFATGALLGTGITLAATSGSRNAERSPDYYDYKRAERNRSDLRREIKDEERELARLNSKIRKLEKEIDRAQNKKHKSSDSDDIKYKQEIIAEHKDEISDRKDHIRDLKEELRNVF